MCVAQVLMSFGLGERKPEGGFKWDSYLPFFREATRAQVEAYGQRVLDCVSAAQQADGGVTSRELLHGWTAQQVSPAPLSSPSPPALIRQMSLMWLEQDRNVLQSQQCLHNM